MMFDDDKTGEDDGTPEETILSYGEDDKGSADDKSGEDGTDDKSKEPDEGGDDKDADDKDGDGEGDKDGGEDDAGSDEGLYEVKAPEGVELDTGLLEAVSPILRKMNATPEQAQELTDAYAGAAKAVVDKQVEEWNATTAQWAEDAKADKDMGGDNWDKTAESFGAAMKFAGTPELDAFLTTTRAGNHPEVIRFATKFGEVLAENAELKKKLEGEDEVYTKGKGKDADVPIEQTLYGATTPPPR